MSGPSQLSVNSKPFIQPAATGTRPTPPIQSVFSDQLRPRKNVGQACDGCRQGKKKCNGAKPACGACVANQVECTYSTLDRRRAEARNKELDKVQAEKDELAAILQALVRAPEHVSFAMLEDLRRSDRFSPDPQASTSASLISAQCQLGQQELSELSLPALPLSSVAQIFTTNALPPKSEVREGAARFFANVSPLFYVMAFNEFEVLLDKTYHSSACVDMLSLCEICSLASVGFQYLPDQSHLDIKQSLYLTATVRLKQCLEADKVRTIRILVCLACYEIVEHREAARLSIAFGLHLARSELGYPTSDLELFRRIYRTLIFTHCWLSTSLGFSRDLGDMERQFVGPSLKSVNGGQMGDAEVQELAGTVAVFKADILSDEREEDLDASIIDKHMARLDEWYYGLPSEIRLTALFSDRSSPLSNSQRRGLLFVHVLFLGAIILVHRRLLTSMDDAQLRDLTSHSLHGKLQTYIHRLVTAARQIAQIFRLVDDEKIIFRRYWLCISDIYSSSAVLLFIASSKLAGLDAADSDEELSLASRLVRMLSGASIVDPVARRLYSLLRPLHAAVNDLRETASNSTLGLAETANFGYRCRAAMETSINHLQNVFGDEVRLGILNLELSEAHIPT